MDGQHTHGSGGGGVAILALAAVAIVAIVAPVVLAAVHALLVILTILIVGVLGVLGLTGAVAAALIWRHGWPSRDALSARHMAHMIGGDTHGNLGDSGSYRVVDGRRQGQARAIPQGCEEDQGVDTGREQEARGGLPTRTPATYRRWPRTRDR